MSSIGTGYDLSSSTYSPDGRLFQIEYANKAVENSGTAIGLRVKDGVVLAVEKLVQSKLLVPGSNKRIATVDDHAGLAYTLYSSVRPFGLSSILAGVDKVDGPSLFCVEPSGVYWGYRGCAIGKGRTLAKTEIEKLKLEEMTCREAINEAARIIYTVHDDAKDKDFELELTWVGPESGGRHLPVPKELQLEAERKAKEGLATEMED